MALETQWTKSWDIVIDLDDLPYHMDLHSVPISMYGGEEHDNVVWYRNENFNYESHLLDDVWLICVEPSSEMYEEFGDFYQTVDCRGDRCRKDKDSTARYRWCIACHGDEPDGASVNMPMEMRWVDIPDDCVKMVLHRSFS